MALYAINGDQRQAVQTTTFAQEFGNWQDSNRRIDLCLGKDAGHMELQAIRYAAMVSSMTLDQAIAAHAQMLSGDNATDQARDAILDFLKLDSVDEAELNGEVRIILVSADFSPEITTSVIWLQSAGVEHPLHPPATLQDGVAGTD